MRGNLPYGPARIVAKGALFPVHVDPAGGLFYNAVKDPRPAIPSIVRRPRKIRRNYFRINHPYGEIMRNADSLKIELAAQYCAQGGPVMPYVVYVNTPTNKAIVHDTSCGKYQARKRNRTSNGFWTQPYSDFATAWQFAQSTGKKTVDTCAFCCEPAAP